LNNIEGRVEEIFRGIVTVLGMDYLLNDTSVSTENLDSLRKVQVLVLLEEALGQQLEDSTVEKITSLVSIRILIENLIGKNDQ
jgi:acyl carrier protein